MAKQESGPLTFWEMLQSTLWAALGVQKGKNRERDFTRGNWVYFIYMGVGFAAVFVFLMTTLVQHIVAGT